MSENAPNPTLASRLQTVHAGLRPDLEFSRHTFRGKPSYVVRNPITFQSHNFSTADYQILIALDNERPLGEAFNELVEAGKIDEEQEDGFYLFILKLHQSGFLSLPISDGKSLYAHFRRRQISQRRARLTSFLSWRVPLINPDMMLDRTIRHVAPLFSRGGFLLWLVLMIVCAGILQQRWADFTEPLQTILVAKNLAGLWVLLILLKVIHEFGHAYMCKRFGGKVPEMGAYFICLTPCAYVDASAAWGFSSKKERLAVSLGGMYVESIVAGIALLIWNATGPSLVNSFAHQTVTLAGIMTIGFNINPLMRYDGYYLFSDLVEIPNLREQSIAQVRAVCKRLVLGVRSDTLPFSLKTRILLFGFGVCASVWKFTLVIAICTGIALKVYILGVLMAVTYGSTVLWGTLSRFIGYLWKSPETEPVRGRAVALGLIVLVGLPLGIGAIPIHRSIETRGVVASLNETPVHAQTAGFLRQSQVVPGQTVESNSVICILENKHTTADAAVAIAELDLLNLEAQCQFEEDPARAAITRKRAVHAQRMVRHSRQNVDHLTVRAPAAGRIIDSESVPRTGRFVREGEKVATITSGDWVVRSPVTAEHLADTKPQVGQTVRIRLLGDAAREYSGTITDVAEAGSKEIASASLTQLGGGTIAVAPDTMTAGEPFFEITIRLDNKPTTQIRHGMTTLVAFDAPAETVGVRLYRSALRFLNKLRT